MPTVRVQQVMQLYKVPMRWLWQLQLQAHVHVQDLSMGWLDCEPDSLFLPTHFAVGDVQHVLPRQAISMARALASQLPHWLLRDVMYPLFSFTFIARPMQASHASCVRPGGLLILDQACSSLRADFRVGRRISMRDSALGHMRACAAENPLFESGTVPRLLGVVARSGDAAA